MIINLLLSVAFAAGLAVKAPEASSHEFFIYAQNSEVQKISTHFLECKKDIGLQQTLRDAQYHFLNASLEKAMELFETIAENKWNCDWKDDERKIMNFALFRLAQLSSDEMKQVQYLTDALNFDDSIAPDEAVFPPPLVKLYKRLKRQLVKKSFPLPAFAKNYSFVLRNGQFINLSQPALETYSLRARYTFVSDAYKPETLVTTADDLSSRQIEPQAWVQGDCKSPRLAEELNDLKQEVHVFFSQDCIAQIGTETKAALSSQSLDLMRASPAPGLTSSLQVSEKKSWLQRNYLWVGAAVVGSFLIVHQMHQRDEPQKVTVPTTTYNTN